MRHARTLTLFVLLGLGAQAAADFETPPVGVSVNQSFDITLPTALPVRCISFTFRNATLIIDRALAESIATGSDSATPIFQVTRYRDLLGAITGRKDRFDCDTFDLKNNATHVLPFLVAVRKGQAIAIPEASTTPVPKIQIHYSASEAFGGDIIYRLPSGQPFHFQRWWGR